MRSLGTNLVQEEGSKGRARRFRWGQLCSSPALLVTLQICQLEPCFAKAGPQPSWLQLCDGKSSPQPGRLRHPRGFFHRGGRIPSFQDCTAIPFPFLFFFFLCQGKVLTQNFDILCQNSRRRH